MKPAAIRRVSGLAVGTALIALGAAHIGIQRAGYDNPKVKPLCEAGFCANQFSPERVFELSMKASLGDPRGQLDDFRRATRLSPASAYRWADLGEAEFNVRDYALAQYALARAMEAGPRSPVVLVRAANLEFQMGNENQVLHYLAALLSDPFLADYYDTAFLTYSRLGLPINRILESVPQQSNAVSKLLIFWTQVGKVNEAIATWNWAHGKSLADRESTGRFFAFLIKAGQQVVAQQLWQAKSISEEPDYRKTNWIYNAGFERAPALSPYDWAIESRPDVEAARVEGPAYEGRCSVHMRFRGETNADYQGTYQDMWLEPGHYRYSAMLKTEQLTTDEGLRLHIFDQPTQAKLNIWSDTVVGTQNWKKIEGGFDVPADIKVVRLTVDRKPSMMFDNKIGGNAWIDNVRLFRQ